MALADETEVVNVQGGKAFLIPKSLLYSFHFPFIISGKQNLFMVIDAKQKRIYIECPEEGFLP